MNTALKSIEARPLVDYYSRLTSFAFESTPSFDWQPLPMPASMPRGLEQLLGTAKVKWTEMPHGAPISAVLDLRQDPKTNTTKTFASAMIVARAVNHIWATGERITILTPSSANKATALRSSVLTAIELGLIDSNSLSVVSVVPESSKNKLRRSRLTTDRRLRSLNPLLVLPGQFPECVKPLVAEAAQQLASSTTPLPDGERLWLTLKLENYAAADAGRALFEYEVSPPSRRRLHAHSVSSAYGLLGYAHGRDLLRAENQPGSEIRPGFLLVQHLHTSDMVQDLVGSRAPAYERDVASGAYRQDADPHWPNEVDDPDENMETTFYTQRPVTSAAMTSLIRESFGSGVVVSRRECLEEYAKARIALANADIDLPENAEDLREWATVMCWTGMSKARQRGLIPTESDAILHASGSYALGDYETVPENERDVVTDATQVVEAVFRVIEERGRVT